MGEKLLLVNKNDNLIGSLDTELCHLGAGKLHRAFSVFLFTKDGKLVLQQRGKNNKLWPLYWSNSCCSHPKVDESYIQAGKKKVYEELGIKCDLEYIYKFKYQAKYENLGAEREICGVLVGQAQSEPLMNTEDMTNVKLVHIDELIEDIKKNKDKYTPWFVKEIRDLTTKYVSKIKKYCKVKR